MKLRIKVSGTRHLVTVAEPENDGIIRLEHVKAAIYQQLGPTVENLSDPAALILSLNGKSPIEEDDDIAVSEVGLVSGDMVHVINPGSNINQSSSVQQISSAASRSMASSSYEILDDSVLSLQEADNNVDPELQSSVSEDHSLPDYEFLPVSSYSRLSGSEIKTLVQAHGPNCCNEYVNGTPLPHLLRRIFESAKPDKKEQLVGIVLHVLFLEKGFVNKTTGDESGILLSEDWKCGSHKMSLKYNHPSCEGVTFTVGIVNMNTVLVLQGKAELATHDADSDISICKCQIPVEKFLTSEAIDICNYRDQSSSSWLSLSYIPSNIYRNLSELSRTFRDALINNLFSDGMELVGGEGEPTIFSLPYDAVILIFELLDFKSLARMSCASRFYRELSLTPHLWKALFLKDFRAQPVSAIVDWKAEYKETFLRRKAAEERRSTDSMTFPHPRFDPFPHNPFNENDPFAPPPLLPPGILGGDHDRFPVGPHNPFGVGPILPRPRFDPPFPGGAFFRPGSGSRGPFGNFFL